MTKLFIRRTFFFILLSICVQFSFGQDKKCAIVLDSKTKTPVPFATVVSTGFGTYADTNGLFYVNENINDTFTISSVGYKEMKVLLSSNYSCDTFFIEQLPISLFQIEIGKYPWLTNNFFDQISLKDIKDTKFTSNVIEGVTIIKYFSNPDTNRKFVIGSFKIKVRQKSEVYEPRKVRIKIFEATSSGRPGNDILQSNEIYTIAKPAGDYIEFDLNRFFVIVPPSGYFIGLEFLTPKADALNSGTFSIVGKLSKEFENGDVFIRYYTNIFRPYVFSSTQKVNVFFNTRVYEYK